jgi:hypothetical protein
MADSDQVCVQDSDQPEPLPQSPAAPCEPSEGSEPAESADHVAAPIVFKGIGELDTHVASGAVDGDASSLGTGFNNFDLNPDHLDKKANDALNEDERRAKEQREQIDQDAGDTPVISQWAKASAWVDEKTTDFEDGAMRAATDLGTGTVKQIGNNAQGLENGYEHFTQYQLHPIDTAEKDYDAAKNEIAKEATPEKLAQDASDHPGEGAPEHVKQSIADGNWADAAGQTAVHVGVGAGAGPEGEEAQLAETEETVPATMRSPTGPELPSTPTPEVSVVEPPPLQPNQSINPEVPAPDAAAESETGELGPETYKSEDGSFDKDHVTTPEEVANGQTQYPPNGGAMTPWRYKKLPEYVERSRNKPFDGDGNYQPDYGKYPTTPNTPIETLALPPKYDPDAAQLMGLPPDAQVPPQEYGLYKTDGSPMLQSKVHPAYGQPGGGEQYYTGENPRACPRNDTNMNDVTGSPKTKTLPDGTEIPVHPVERTGGKFTYVYGNDWQVGSMSQEEMDDILRREAARQQSWEPTPFDRPDQGQSIDPNK